MGWKYIRALGYFFIGRWGSAYKTLMENQYVMEATYDKAIQKNTGRLQTVTGAVAELVRLEQQDAMWIKDNAPLLLKAKQKKDGAQIALQQRLDQLRKDGKQKVDIEKDGKFIELQKAFLDHAAALKRREEEFDKREESLAEKEANVAKFKAELHRMQRANKELESEKNEALAEVAIAQQQESINATLASISKDSVDQDLAAAREARQRVKSRAAVVAELADTADSKDEQFIQLAEQQEAKNQLDSLLNWGEDEKKENLEPAKLQE